jgi:DNA polymerase V
LDLTGVCEKDPIAYGQRIRQAVFRATGIPVCVGMGSTKTLAKLANFAAKKWQKTVGVWVLSDPVRSEKLMKIVPVNEVWGIGSRTTAKLNQLGIHTVWDLATQSSQRIQARFNVVVARTVKELNGVACLELEAIAPHKQQIVCSRSFSRRLTEFSPVSQALAEFCGRAAEKLRHQHSVTGCITVFIRTSPFDPQERQYQRTASIKLDIATQDSRTLITTANRLLKAIFKEGYGYQKCGVQLSYLQPDTQPSQLELFAVADNGLPTENRPLMQVLDRINRRYPKAISSAATDFDKTWKPKAERVSPHYTTDWQQLVCVKC